MLFNVTNRQTARDTHCGVLEFIAEEGVIYMPYWVRFIQLTVCTGHTQCTQAHQCITFSE